MNTRDLRALVKRADPEATLSGGSEYGWTARTRYRRREVEQALALVGLTVASATTEGSRWDWTHVLFVCAPEGSAR
jgi:hypothetical protein